MSESQLVLGEMTFWKDD